MKKYILISLTLWVQLFNAQSLNLETCLKMADTANLTIRNSKIQIESNKKLYNQYMSARFPQLSFAGDYRYNAKIQGQIIPGEFSGGAPGTFGTVQFGVPFVLSNTLQLKQILYDPQVNYGINSLKINQQIVELQDELTSQNIHFEVTQTYYTLQGVLKQAQFIDSNILNMESLITNMEAYSKEGMVIQTEVDKLKISRLDLVNKKQTLASAKFQLEMYMRILLGKKATDPLEITIDPNVLNSILKGETERNIIELKLLETQKQMTEEERKGNNMSYLPNLSFYGIYNYNYNINTKTNYRQGLDGAFVGVQLNWILFDGMQKYNKNKVIKFKQETLNNQHELMSQQMDMNIANAKNQIEIQVGLLATATEQLNLSQSVFKQSEARFKEGTIDSNDLIKAEIDLQNAQTNLITTYLALRKAELDYLKAMGQL